MWETFSMAVSLSVALLEDCKALIGQVMSTCIPLKCLTNCTPGSTLITPPFWIRRDFKKWQLEPCHVSFQLVITTRWRKKGQIKRAEETYTTEGKGSAGDGTTRPGLWSGETLCWQGWRSEKSLLNEPRTSVPAAGWTNVSGVPSRIFNALGWILTPLLTFMELAPDYYKRKIY